MTAIEEHTARSASDRRDGASRYAVRRASPEELAQRFMLSFEVGRGRSPTVTRRWYSSPRDSSSCSFITVMIRRATELSAAETSLRPAEDLRAFLIAFG